MKRLCALAVLACAGATAAPASAAGYLKIDRNWYSIPGDQAIHYYPDARGLFVLDASASNCRRPGGGIVVPGGNAILYYAAGGIALPLQGIVSYRPTERSFELLSSSGDVICDGAIPAPPFAQSIQVFFGGFED